MSKKYSLNRQDTEKILIGACMAVAGALLTYFTKVITNTDFGEWTPLVVALWSVIVNAVRKYLVEE